MTQNVAGWLPNLLGPVLIQVAGVAQTPRGNINFAAATGADNATTDTLTVTLGASPSTLAGDGTGYSQLTAVNGTVATTPKGKDTDVILSTTTPDATAATIYTYATTADRLISIDGIITVFDGGAGHGKYKLDGLYKNLAGTLVKHSTTPADVATGPESTAGLDVILTLSGANIIVQGAGFASGATWTGRIFVHETSV